MEKERFIPEGWREVTVGRIANRIQSGGTPKSDVAEYYEGEIPFTSVEDLTSCNKYLYKTKKHISEKGLNNSTAWVVPINSLLYSIYATLGVARINKIEVTTNQAILNIIPNNNEIDIEFLFYYMEFSKSRMLTYSAQTTQNNLNATIVTNFNLYIPTSLSEQQQIVSILSAADSAIEQTENLIEKYKNIKKGLMQDLLNPKEGWKKVKLEEVGEVVTGPFGSALHEKDYTDTGTPIVNPQNIVEGSIIAIEECLVNDETVERLKKYKLETGNIIIARRGEMGRCAIVERHQEGWLCGTGCFIIKVNSKKINPHFLYLLLSSDKTKQILENNSIGSTMHNLNQKRLKSNK